MLPRSWRIEVENHAQGETAEYTSAARKLVPGIRVIPQAVRYKKTGPMQNIAALHW